MRSSFKRSRVHESHVSDSEFCIIKVWGSVFSALSLGSDFPKPCKSRSRIFKQRSRRLGKSRILPFATPDTKASSTRIRIFLNPQLFLSRFKNLIVHTWRIQIELACPHASDGIRIHSRETRESVPPYWFIVQ